MNKLALYLALLFFVYQKTNAQYSPPTGLTDTQLRASPLSALQSGAWTMQPGNVANTTPWLFTENVKTSPTVTAIYVGSTALEDSRVLKSTPGYLVSCSIYNSAVVSQFILIIDASAVPADGPVTLMHPPISIGARSNVMVVFPVPIPAVSGVVVCNSTTGSFTKTIGAANCVFFAQVQ
jgi:hypothetical protein